MEALLDTHALLWWLADDKRLTKRARQVIEQKKNVIWVSAASAWEVSIKLRLGKLLTATELCADFDAHVEREGFRTLGISTRHAIRAGMLAGNHKDPFDRMLIAQAQQEHLALVSNESLFDAYGISRIW